MRLYSYEGTQLASPSWMARAIGTQLVSSFDDVGNQLCECGCQNVTYVRCPCHAVVSISLPKPGRERQRDLELGQGQENAKVYGTMRKKWSQIGKSDGNCRLSGRNPDIRT
jgi:hypothetical protein